MVAPPLPLLCLSFSLSAHFTAGGLGTLAPTLWSFAILQSLWQSELSLELS